MTNGFWELWWDWISLWIIPIGFMFGLIIGSFLNVVIHRVPLMLQRAWEQDARSILQLPENPKEQSRETAGSGSHDISGARYNLWTPGSQCPECQRPIRAWENLPLLSFILLRARCPGCGQRISWQYPAVELLTGVLFAFVLWHFGATWAGGAALILTGFLIAASGIDARTTLLPDQLTLPLVWLGLLANSFGLFTDLESAVFGAIAGYLTLWLVYHGFRLLTGKEGMGYGDFKLLAALGAWMGWQALPMILLFASMVGALVGIALILFRGRDRNIPIPFGPYLAAAGFLALIWGDSLASLYFP